jgi:ComF family protein
MVHFTPDAEVANPPEKGKPLLARALRFVYPPRCIACGEEVETEKALCGPCWSEAWFISTPCCDACAAPLPGAAEGDPLFCDDCMAAPRPWTEGRAVVVYSGTGRRISLALKHGDRLDIAGPVGRWMAAAARDILTDSDVIAPVPLHWTRLFRRRYNQSALLAEVIAAGGGCTVAQDLLIRRRRTVMQKGMTREERMDNQRQAITANPKRLSAIAGKRILLVDDVMTTGATLSACAEACHAAGAVAVNIVVFARVATGS